MLDVVKLLITAEANIKGWASGVFKKPPCLIDRVETVVVLDTAWP